MSLSRSLLVVLYGPPGAGKLSIARELAQLTSFRLLDNHLFFNIAIRLYERFSEPLEQLYDLLHLVTLKDALRNDISGIILTICAADARNRSFFAMLTKDTANEVLDTYFVQIICQPSELRRRIGCPERVTLGKLTDPTQVSGILALKDYMS